MAKDSDETKGGEWNVEHVSVPRKRRKGPLILLVAIVTCATLAIASTAYTELSYVCGGATTEPCSFSKTKDGSGNTIVVVCDRDRDGNWAYAYHVARSGLEGYTWDRSGANDGDCGQSGSYPSEIRSHRTCVSIPYAPDYCPPGNTEYH